MPLLDPPGLLSFNWDLTNTSLIFLSTLFGFLLQWSGALALGATSATSHVVLGQFKTCVIMLAGYLLFNSDPGIVSLCGAIIALLAMSVYTSLNLHEASDTTNQLPKLNPSASRQPLRNNIGDVEVDVRTAAESA
ncbi:hypothetical protein QJS10_CPB17g00459 [Acorus calamus]|uniref:Sugar phosphate transporter domain-containing protein n=1 Tax=Acorus calamus TaxID=4465 RepID=A0AAV9CW43_ACOCL|nr:hypothetical protein QJS10_CPB17g00459 [Acorus calamus]